MDQDNPAVSKQLVVPPTILDAVAQDPKVLQGYARKFLMTQLSVLQDRMKDPTIPLSTRMAFADLLTKHAALPTAQAQSGQGGQGGAGSGGFSVNIMLSGAGQAASASPAQVVDVKATTVEIPLSTPPATTETTAE